MKKFIYTLMTVSMITLSFNSFSACKTNEGKVLTASDSINGYQIDKDSVEKLKQEVPELAKAVNTQVFSGALQTCGPCSGKFIKCD
jgi:hypothetical protein